MAIAALFPGQGSQSIGMLADLAAHFPIITQTFEQASEVLGCNLWQIVQQGTDADLNKTTITQPVMLSAGVAVWRLWLQQGGKRPTAGAGHSLGEYAALVAAESLDFTQAIRLVSERAHLMEQAVPTGQGAMAAILGMDDEQLIEVCHQISASVGVVEAANFNSPGQIVIAGKTEAIDAALQTCVELGAKRSIKLAVSVPSHCSLMRQAADALTQSLAMISFKSTTFTVLHNVDAAPRLEDSAIKLALADQLYKPVQWTKTIEALRDNHAIDLAIEFGGRTLTGLNRRIDRKLEAIAIYDTASLEAALALGEQHDNQ